MTFIHWWNILAAYKAHPRAVFWKSDSQLKHPSSQSAPCFILWKGSVHFPLRCRSFDHFCFLCFCDVPAPLTASPPPGVTHLQEAARTAPLCITPVILTYDRLLPIAVCLAYSPDHSTAAPMKTHLNEWMFYVSMSAAENNDKTRKLSHRGVSQKREPRDEWWRLTERGREKDVNIFHIRCFCRCFVLRRLFAVV